MGKVFKKGETYIAKYDMRTSEREKTLMKATMNFVAYFMGLGDAQIDAEIKVSNVSTDVAPYLYAYTLGNKVPLINAIQNCNLAFMNQDAKDYLINALTV